MPDATPRLSAFDIGCIVVSGILGVGIFFTPARVALAVDAPSHAILAWCLGGVVAILGAFVFADLAVKLPGHGGTFSWVHAAFGPLPAFLYGWANWLVIQSGALVVIGLVMVDYASVLLFGKPTGSAADKAFITIGAILVFTTLNAIGLRVGRGVQNTLSILKTSAVFALVLLGLWVTGRGEAGAALQSSNGAPATTHGLFGGLAAAILPVMFSYGGWQQGSFVGGAARKVRSVSTGIVGGVLVIVLAYVTVNLAFFGLLGFEGTRHASALGADAARVALEPFGLGTIAESVLAAMVVLSSLGIMNTICFAPPFVLHAMAKEGLFLQSVGRLHPTRHVPVVGVLAQGLWAVFLCAVLQLGFGVDLGFLLDGVVFVDWIFYALCAAALLKLGTRGRSRVTAVAFNLLALAITVGAITHSPKPSVWGLGILLAGVAWFLGMRRRA